MLNLQANMSIVELSKSEAYLREIGSRYITSDYYDVSICREAKSWKVVLTRKTFDSILDKFYHGRLFEDHVEEPRAFVAAVNGTHVGWIELGYDRWNNRMRVWEFLVEETFRKRGIGKALMNHAVKVANEKGARMLVLETQTNNSNAIEFYLNFGFELVGFDVAAYSNEDVARKEVRLELGLKLTT